MLSPMALGRCADAALDQEIIKAMVQDIQRLAIHIGSGDDNKTEVGTLALSEVIAWAGSGMDVRRKEIAKRLHLE